MKSLVGYTGFVGSNIYCKGKFEGAYNSSNIQDAYGTNPEFLIYAGLRAEKYLANKEPERDMQTILEAEKNIKLINPKKLVLISTIDVLKNPNNVDENTKIETDGLQPYGYNRYQFELWVRENYPDALIIRLPALFGINLKKNFIYDFINIIPFMLNNEKMEEIIQKDMEIKKYYKLQDNGFYKLGEVNEMQRQYLKQKFKTLGFSALNFTDSRNKYQFYPLNRLWDDIQLAFKNNIILWHPATEPVSAGELYKYLTGEEFINEITDTPADYNYKTIYDKVFGGNNGYICDKIKILEEIKKFIEGDNQ